MSNEFVTAANLVGSCPNHDLMNDQCSTPSLTSDPEIIDLSSDDEQMVVTTPCERRSNIRKRKYASSTAIKVIPNNLMCIIFAQLPMLDILQVVNRVCKRWNGIITKSHFIRHQKFYYMYKFEIPDAAQKVNCALCVEPTIPCNEDEQEKRRREDEQGFVTAAELLTLPSTASSDSNAISSTLDENGPSKLDSVALKTFNVAQNTAGPTKYKDEKLMLKIEQSLFGLIEEIFVQFSQRRLLSAESECFEAVLQDDSKSHHFNWFKSAEYWLQQVAIPMVESLLKENNEFFQTICIDHWMSFAAMLITASDMHQILGLFKRLASVLSCETMISIRECAYCVATYLLAFERMFGVSCRLHYNLYYALYLFENIGSKKFTDLYKCDTGTLSPQKRQKLSGQSAILEFIDYYSSRDPTNEQFRIINYDLQPGDQVKIVAFAGTGKTTTLKEYCKARPQSRFLVIVYNRDVSDRAQSEFPANTVCRTMHSIAYGAVGKWYKINNKLVPNLKHGDLITKNLVKGIPGINKYLLARFVVKTIENYMASADDEILDSHIPSQMFDISAKEMKVLPCSLEKPVEEFAKRIWKIMVDKEDPEVGMTHDGYLKLFQIWRYSVKHSADYDFLMVDEAQDCTPCALSIISCQSLPKIFVGDPHQQIYSFRGAINALDKVPCTRTFFLTQSFRFGPEIAFFAQCCLQGLKKERRKTIIGTDRPSFVDGTPQGALTTICRANSTIFDHCVALHDADPTCTDKNLHILGGLDKFGLDRVVDIYHLKCGDYNQIKNTSVKNFGDFFRYKKWASSLQDSELCQKIDIVEKYGDKIPAIADMLNRRHTKDQKLASYILTTAHKAKGLEFDTVRIADDFIDPDLLLRQGVVVAGNNINHSEDDKDERNLLYVAVTRAKKSLVLNQSLIKFIYYMMGDHCETVLPFKTLQDRLSPVPVGCKQCLRAFNDSNPYQLILYRNKLAVTTNYWKEQVCNEGSICQLCASKSKSLSYRFVDAAGRFSTFMGLGLPRKLNADDDVLHPGHLTHYKYQFIRNLATKYPERVWNCTRLALRPLIDVKWGGCIEIETDEEPTI